MASSPPLDSKSSKYRILVSKEPLSPCIMARAMHISFCLCSASTMSPMRSPPSPWALHEDPWGQNREAISQIKSEKMRGEVGKFREGFVAIDDTYNSNLRALSEMVRV